MRSRKNWLLTLLSLGTVSMLVAAPLARADDDRDRHDDRRGHDGRRELVVQPRQENEEVEERFEQGLEPGFVDQLVTVLNEQVLLLAQPRLERDEDREEHEDEDEAFEIEHLRFTSLSALTSRLNNPEAALVTSTVNANAAALQAFLAAGSANAMAIDSALAQAGVSQSSVLAILPMREEQLLVITS